MDSSESRSFCRRESWNHREVGSGWYADRFRGWKVENLELKLVTRMEDLPVVVHGTYLKLWDVICTSSKIPFNLDRLTLRRLAKEGLKTMTRNHIHCAVGLVGSEEVTSGTFHHLVYDTIPDEAHRDASEL